MLLLIGLIFITASIPLLLELKLQKNNSILLNLARHLIPRVFPRAKKKINISWPSTLQYNMHEDVARLAITWERVVISAVVVLSLAFSIWTAVDLWSSSRSLQLQQQALERFEKMNDQAFAASLAEFQDVVQKQSTQYVAQADTRSISAKLRRISSNENNYWPSVLGFLRVATASAPRRMPRGVINLAGYNTGMVGSMIDNATIILDGGFLDTGIVRDSVIIFTDKTVTLKNVRFINCSFVFPISINPPRQTKEAADQLLASSDLKETILNLSA
jgi:hypothetical protein